VKRTADSSPAPSVLGSQPEIQEVWVAGRIRRV